VNCIHCGKANLRKRETQLDGEIKAERFTVSMRGLVCPKCGFTTVEGEQMPEYMRLVADAYRTKHGLLTSDEIRNRRARLGMSQAEFAKYLGVGIASLKRWEMGKVQDVSSDELIKLRTDESAASRNLQAIREAVDPWRDVYRPFLNRALEYSWVREPPKFARTPRFCLPVRPDSKSERGRSGA
jgi:putative zinc finger/helix-turn-helix YgiT family protein